jgi:methylthioxylose transferase
LLSEYISRIPIDSPGNWPTHLAGHPPGAALFFWMLVRLGLGSWLAAGVVIIVIAATTPVAVLVTLRRLGAGDAARTAAPFLVFGPSAIWSAVSADAMFTAIVAWGLCLLAISATTRLRLTRALWALAAGVVLGLCMFLSYGLPLVGLLAVAILVVARSWRPLPWAAASALTVVVAFAAAGFAWWDAYPVLAARYWDGIAAIRPYGYWVWGNLGALAISAGPIVGSSIAVAAVTITGYRRASIGHRVVVALTLAATFAIVLADLSGMSKAEVERIWLPFMPWMLVGTALLPARWRRGGLAVQIAVALVVQHLFFTRW